MNPEDVRAQLASGLEALADSNVIGDSFKTTVEEKRPGYLEEARSARRFRGIPVRTGELEPCDVCGERTVLQFADSRDWVSRHMRCETFQEVGNPEDISIAVEIQPIQPIERVEVTVSLDLPPT